MGEEATWTRSNWITLDNTFDSGRAIDHMFDVLGHHIVERSRRDLRIEDELTIHISSCAPGTGTLYFSTYLCRTGAPDRCTR